MKIVVIVVTYNGIRWIEKCLNSLRDSSLATQVIVIDNASVDGTTFLLEKFYPEVELIKNSNNLGFGKANNIGLKKALDREADFVLLLNQDAWIGDGCIEKLIEILRAHPAIHLLSPFHYNYEGNGIEAYFNDFVLAQYTPGYEETKGKDMYESSFIHAACWMLPAATLKVVGGFDPLFRHTGEDNDYVQRLHSKGMKVGFTPLAKMYHQGTNEGLINPEQNYRLKLNTALLKLKNPRATTAGAWALLGKSVFSTCKRMIGNGNIKGLKVELSLLVEIVGAFYRIRRSRVQQTGNTPFIK